MKNESGRSAVSSQVTGRTSEEGAGEFGANEWLVAEMYEKYLADKNSVDRSWWPILEDRRPSEDPTPTSAIPVVQPQGQTGAPQTHVEHEAMEVGSNDPDNAALAEEAARRVGDRKSTR